MKKRSALEFPYDPRDGAIGTLFCLPDRQKKMSAHRWYGKFTFYPC